MSSHGQEALVLKRPDEAAIGRPSGVRAPLKSNVFEVAVGVTTQLQPMFSYTGAGSIVPCVAVMQGVEDGNYGQFFHFNTVEEIALVYGSNNAMLGTGSVFATQPTHGVNSFLKDPTDPEAFILITITQHQNEEGDQNEAIMFRCEKCSHELVRIDYDATPHDVEGHNAGQWGGTDQDPIPMFPTLWGGVEAFVQYDDESVRTCGGCGHLNPAFPENQRWGWSRWVTQWKSANSARRALDASAAELMGTTEEAAR